MVFDKIVYSIFTLILICNINNAIYFSPNDYDIFTNNMPNSYFGLSVQLQNSLNLEENRVLIGAPKYISDSGNETGVTYSCLVHSKKCNAMMLDVKDDLRDSWLGAQIDATSNVEGNLMTCAPRSTMRNFLHVNQIYDRQAGLCYFIQEGNTLPIESEEVTLSTNQDYQFEDNGYNYIFGQAGFSVHFSERSSSFIVGIPGLRNWTGSVMNVFVKEGKVVQKIVNAKRFDNKVSTYAYFGYTVSSGKFTTGNTVQFVAGAPRANDMTGTVYIFEIGPGNDQPFRNRYELKGSTFGEYFGAAVTVADINGDGIDDIIIGAPLYFTKHIVDSGRVYVYLCKKNYQNKIQFSPAQILNTTDTKFAYARFGSAISSLGDINKDGYTDIVVGAPYYNENGAIFIYLGSKQGLNENYNQIIKASEFKTDLRGFGYSLSKGLDIDDNKYNDVAVGAYLSGHVVLLKTRPVITMELDLSSNIQGININVKTFNIKSCLKYHGVDVTSTVNINLQITSPKTVILNENSNNWFKTITITTNNKICETISAELMFKTNDDLDDVLLEMEVNIDEDNSEVFCSKCPIIDEKSPKSIKHVIPFVSGCLNNDYCKPDLIVAAKFLFGEPKLAIGFKDELGVQISIDNIGENAFIPIIVVVLPERVTLSKLLGNCQGTSQINCTFTLGRVIETNTQNNNLTIYLDITKLMNSDENLSLNISVSSRGDDANPNTNQHILTLPLYVNFSTYILGKAFPAEIQEATIMSSLTHQFDVQNIGFSTLEEVEIMMFVPQLNDDHLEVKEVKGCIEFNIETYQFTEDIHEDENTNLDIVDSEHAFVLACNKNQIECSKITCKVQHLNKNDYKRIILDLKVNTQLLGKLDDKDIISLYTLVKATSKYSDKFFWGKSMTKIIKQKITTSSTKWIVTGSILGCVGLLILVIILYKLKFFKRQNIESFERDQTTSLIKQNQNTSRLSRSSKKNVENELYGDYNWSNVSLPTSSNEHSEIKQFSDGRVTVSK